MNLKSKITDHENSGSSFETFSNIEYPSKQIGCGDQRLTNIIKRLTNNNIQPVEIKCEPEFYGIEDSPNGSNYDVSNFNIGTVQIDDLSRFV